MKYKHGQILYNELNEPTSIVIGSFHNKELPWNIMGNKVYIAVATAKYRSKALTFSRNIFDVSSLEGIDTKKAPYSTTWFLNNFSGTCTSDQFQSLNNFVSEENIDKTINMDEFVSSRDATTAILMHDKEFQAVKYCNSIISDNKTMCLPTILVLLRIFQSAEILKELDPTIDDYKEYDIISLLNSEQRIFSSTLVSNKHVWGMNANLAPGYIRPYFPLGVIPCLELPLIS